MDLRSYLIIGCGHFGSQAIPKLLRKDPYSKIIVVDKNKKALQKVSHLPVETILCDSTLYLNSFLSGCAKTDYIIPAVPFHLAFEFILSQLKPLGAKRRKIPPLLGLPNPMKGKTGDLYTSFANFLCPENCPEPSSYCTMTGTRHQKSLYQLLKDLSVPFESTHSTPRSEARGMLRVDTERRFLPRFKNRGLAPSNVSKVIRSQQLEPGVGGFKVKVLLDMMADIKKRRSSNRLILISTASRCHGVTSALSF